MTILDDIVSHKRKSIYENKRPRLSDKLQEANQALIIGEIKRASPSKGVFAPDLKVSQQVAYYDSLDVDAFSVLTDSKYFKGSFKDLEQVSKCTPKPILCKDFIIEESQIAQAFAYGASIILLIASLHSRKRLEDLIDFAHRLKLEVLMEVRELEEIQHVKGLSFDILGINNRNLKDFETQSNYGEGLINEVKRAGIEQVVISESGFSSRRQVNQAFEKGFKGVLMGEALVKGVYHPHHLIKICGLSTKTEIDQVALSGGTHVGFVLAKSSRQVSMETCEALISYTRQMTELKSVIVLRKASASELNSLFQKLKPDFIQIHADYDLDEPLDDQVKLIRGFHAEEPIDESQYDLLIMDGKKPGMGQTYDWEYIDRALKHFQKPLIVAGGLRPENVKDLLLDHVCEGVDVSSGVESHQVKDLNKIKKFIENVKECQ